jgi:hypothetical protein
MCTVSVVFPLFVPTPVCYNELHSWPRSLSQIALLVTNFPTIYGIEVSFPCSEKSLVPHLNSMNQATPSSISILSSTLGFSKCTLLFSFLVKSVCGLVALVLYTVWKAVICCSIVKPNLLRRAFRLTVRQPLNIRITFSKWIAS